MEHSFIFAPHFENKLSDMGVTRLKRKARRNKQTAAKRQNSIKQLNSKPVIKNIDKEAIKASFGAAPVKEEAPASVEEVTVEETPVAETPVEEVAAEAEETPATEEVEAVAEEAPAAEVEEVIEEAPTTEEVAEEATSEEEADSDEEKEA